MNLSIQEQLLVSENCEKVFERGQADKVRLRLSTDTNGLDYAINR